MSLFIEFHLIQNFAPSNLNRDDTGAPKDALFGGHRRARISSQCLKRAIRNATTEMAIIPAESNSVRTKKLVQLLEARLIELGHTESSPRIESVLSTLGLKVKEDGKTEMLLFLGQGEIEGLAQLIHKYWDELSNMPTGGEQKTKKEAKKEAKAKAPGTLVKEAKMLLDGRKAVDVALFGRMLADLPEANRDAACQVAHAISTHRVEREFDYFTAMDDLKDPEKSGAPMLEQTEFNSATFYRYAVIDARKLIKNLQNDKELAFMSIHAFIKAIAKAIPTGKQNSFAAHNPPSFVGVVLRRSMPLNLANAFEKPIWPKLDKELTAISVEALAKQEEDLSSFYSDGKDSWATMDLTGSWPKDKGAAQLNLGALAKWVVSRTQTELED